MQDPSPTAAASLSLVLPGEAATEALGRALAARLQPGDTVLLAGPVGAGKTHLARAILHARFGPRTEVPSPTYTLVQTYGGPGQTVWHADLYRLASADELVELGLEGAFGQDICLVEWPERLGAAAPPDALRIALERAGAGRLALLRGGRPGLTAGLADAVAAEMTDG